MTWAAATPGRPTGWAWTNTRRRILQRDGGICHVCQQPGADEVDHLVNLADGGTNDDDNLGAIHRDPCHRAKTQREAQRRRTPQRRPPEPHPGLRS